MLPTHLVEAFARWLVRPAVARLWVVACLVLGAACMVLAARVEQDDDVLAFLPPTNPDVAAFQAIASRFGSTDVALVGIRADDPFQPAFVDALRSVTHTLDDTAGIDSVVTLVNVRDFEADPGGGILQGPLIRETPRSEAEIAALRARVMGKDHVVGTLISEEADAVLLIASVSPGVSHRVAAGRIRDAVLAAFPAEDVVWGGTPFFSAWIYETATADLAALTPWAALAILGVLLLAYRDGLGTLLGLFSTSVGIAATQAMMVVTGARYNIMLSSMPVILFALGSAFSIHILSHYDNHARAVGPGREAVVRTVVAVTPALINTGLTTIVGLLSYVVMDMAPMRTFGWFTSAGLTLTLALSLLFVPAVLALWPRPPRRPAPMVVPAAWSAALTRALRAHRTALTVGIAALVVAGGWLSTRVEARMDLMAFFEAGSPPWHAQAFLDDRFGGSQYLLIEADGDLTDPAVLRAIGRVGDRIERVPRVSEVRSVEDALALVGLAMDGAPRVPDQAGQVRSLMRFLEEDPAAARLMTADRQHALIQVEIATQDHAELAAVLDAVRGIVAAEPSASGPAEDIAARWEAVLGRLGRSVDPAALRAWLAAPAAVDAALVPEVTRRLAAFLGSAESFVTLTPDEAAAVGAAVAALGPDAGDDAVRAATGAAIARPAGSTTADDLVVALTAPRRDAWRRARADARADALLAALAVDLPADPRGERARQRLSAALLDLDLPATAAPTVHWTVSGSPVLYEGLARSVQANQASSLLFSLGTVLAIMIVYYGSLTSGLLSMVPMFVTLAVVYGGMGLVGMHLDVGTSILASLVVGTGLDYAVLLLASWHARFGERVEDAAARAVAENQHAIWTSATTVAAGFWVLTLGQARPLQAVGMLTAAAMIVAAASTFLTIPVLARRRQYEPEPDLLAAPPASAKAPTAAG